jgi:hypothetical protein
MLVGFGAIGASMRRRATKKAPRSFGPRRFLWR